MATSDDFFKIGIISFLASILMTLTKNSDQSLFTVSFLGAILFIAYFIIHSTAFSNIEPSENIILINKLLELIIGFWVIILLIISLGNDLIEPPSLILLFILSGTLFLFFELVTAPTIKRNEK